MADDFVEFRKIPRLFRDIVITEKIDGTNAQVVIEQTASLPAGIGDLGIAHDGIMYTMRAGSRTRWITPSEDNYGFARWVYDNAVGLVAELGEGRHFGEWWGQGIQRKYGMDKKVFSLFNVRKFGDAALSLCRVVPVLYTGPFSTDAVKATMDNLSVSGSKAASGFDRPEGIVVFHTAGGVLFKATLQDDEKPKGGK